MTNNRDNNELRPSQRPSITTLGIVDKIIPPTRTGQREEAQIAIGTDEQGYPGFRIGNVLTDEHGDEVNLKMGAHVEITVASAPSASSYPSAGRNARTNELAAQPYDVMIDKQISDGAYQYWEARGRPVGSPQSDWYRAVADLKRERPGSA